MGQAVFILVTLWAFGTAWKNFMKIRRNILLGRDEKVEGNTAQRLRNTLLIAFGQKKMFANWIPAVLHLFIYVAFLFTQVELIEILVDGIFGVHRFFAHYLGFLYNVIISFIEVLSVLAFVATVAFLVRRNVLKISRFQKPELDGFPRFDANMILFLEIVLITAIFSMNGADAVLQSVYPEKYHPEIGKFLVSGWFGPAFLGNWDVHFLVFLERFGWWLHYAMVLVFLNYLPFSKHLHVILAFPNTFYARLNSRGEAKNMPEIMSEVRNMLGLPNETPPPVSEGEMAFFGAKDVTSLSWKNVMDAYSCTECGRCTAACPANQTGKKLSPRKIMMDVRDRADEIGRKLDSGDLRLIGADHKGQAVLTAANFDDGRDLFSHISPEEIRACTTCNACVEACPILINPLDIILQLRRYEILTLSQGPTDWVPMFTSLENGGSPWQMSDERAKWTTQM